MFRAVGAFRWQRNRHRPEFELVRQAGPNEDWIGIVYPHETRRFSAAYSF